MLLVNGKIGKGFCCSFYVAAAAAALAAALAALAALAAALAAALEQMQQQYPTTSCASLESDCTRRGHGQAASLTYHVTLPYYIFFAWHVLLQSRRHRWAQIVSSIPPRS